MTACRPVVRLAGAIASLLVLASCLGTSHRQTVKLPAQGKAATLPMATRFKGAEKFHALCRMAEARQWASLPIGERTLAVAKELLGTPYESWTLEIDDHIEAPSVNFHGLDCWTAYEIPLAFARMIKARPGPWQPEDLLHWIERERYRGGHCDGTYLSRMHYLEEVFHDNQKRGLAVNVTPGLPGATRLRRQISDMTGGWPKYRYLLANPGLLPAIGRMESMVSALPVYHVPERQGRAHRGPFAARRHPRHHQQLRQRLHLARRPGRAPGRRHHQVPARYLQRGQRTARHPGPQDFRISRRKSTATPA